MSGWEGRPADRRLSIVMRAASTYSWDGRRLRCMPPIGPRPLLALTLILFAPTTPEPRPLVATGRLSGGQRDLMIGRDEHLSQIKIPAISVIVSGVFRLGWLNTQLSHFAPKC
jgi:hypothetical protein